MKKLIMILLFVLIFNLLNSLVYARVDDFAEPESVDPAITTVEETNN